MSQQPRLALLVHAAEKKTRRDGQTFGRSVCVCVRRRGVEGEGGLTGRGAMTMAGFYILCQYRGIIRDCSGVLWSLVCFGGERELGKR